MHRYCKQIRTFALGLVILVLPGGFVSLLVLYAVLRDRENSALSRFLNHASDEIGPVVQALGNAWAWLRRTVPQSRLLLAVRPSPNSKSS